MPARIPDEELLDEIRRVAEVVGHTPSGSEMNKYGECSKSACSRRFGSWNQAKEAAGLEQTAPGDSSTQIDYDEREFDNVYSDEGLLADLREVAEIVGYPPSRSEYNEHGQYSYATFEKRFGSWTSAIENAGLDSSDTDKLRRISDSQLLEELSRLAEECGRSPWAQLMTDQGRYGVSIYNRRFGSWNSALEEAGLEPNPYSPTGPDNPNWRGGRDRNLGANWESQRRKARRRDGFECLRCGITEKEHKETVGTELSVHHRIPRREFRGDDGVLDFEAANQLENLITLCASCHHQLERLPVQPELIE